MMIQNAGHIGEDSRKQLSEIFVEAFYHWLQYLSKDKQKLSKALQHIFILDRFYVATLGDEVLGMAACTDRTAPSMQLDARQLRHHLGFIRGILAKIVLQREIVQHKYPFELENRTASIEFVATAPNHSGKGVATKILHHILQLPEFDTFVLEVADTNTSALALYEKLGFAEITRLTMKNQKQSGINELVYMRYQK